MQEKQETLLDTINKLKSDVDKGKEKSAQQKAHIRDLQQVWFCSFISVFRFQMLVCSSVFFFCSPFGTVVCLFVRSLFFCSSLFVSSFTCLSFVFLLSPVLKTLRVFYALLPRSCRTGWRWGRYWNVCYFIFQELNETSKKLVQSETALEMQTKVFCLLLSCICPANE